MVALTKIPDKKGEGGMVCFASQPILAGKTHSGNMGLGFLTAQWT